EKAQGRLLGRVPRPFGVAQEAEAHAKPGVLQFSKQGGLSLMVSSASGVDGVGVHAMSICQSGCGALADGLAQTFVSSVTLYITGGSVLYLALLVTPHWSDGSGDSPCKIRWGMVL